MLDDEVVLVEQSLEDGSRSSRGARRSCRTRACPACPTYGTSTTAGAVLLEKDLDPPHESAQVRDVGEHVVRVYDVSLLTSFGQMTCQLSPEELGDRRNPTPLGNRCHVHRRLDAKHPHTARR